MVKRKGSYKVDRNEKLRGGDGVVVLEHLLTPDEFSDIGRFFARFTMDPGASIGPHVHENEMELFFIIDGEAEYLDGDEWVTLLPGDTALNPKGGNHSIKSVGDRPLELIAVTLHR